MSASKHCSAGTMKLLEGGKAVSFHSRASFLEMLLPLPSVGPHGLDPNPNPPHLLIASIHAYFSSPLPPFTALCSSKEPATLSAKSSSVPLRLWSASATKSPAQTLLQHEN